MNKTLATLTISLLALPAISYAGDPPELTKEARAAMNRRVMNDTFKYDTARKCWKTDGTCLTLRYDHARSDRVCETIYLRASGPIKADYSDATLHSLIVYQPTRNGYRIVDKKKVITYTYGHDADAKYPFNRFLQFGPEHYGWMLVGLEHPSDGGATLATLYGLDGGQLRKLGAVSVAYSYKDEETDDNLKCAVDVDQEAQPQDGYYPLTVTVSGTQKGKPMKTQVIRLPYDPSKKEYNQPDRFICGN